MNKRHLAFGLFLMLAFLLSGCSRIVPEEEPELHVYATVYPIYALTEMIAHDVSGVTVSCITDPQDGCLRAYELSDRDIALLASDADLIMAGGRGLELSSEQKLGALRDHIPTAEVLYGLELLTGSVQDEDSHFSGDDPHLYMSFHGAREIVQVIASTLAVLDPDNEAEYERHLDQALEELGSLEAAMKQTAAVCGGVRTAVLNEALLYPALEYGMDIVSVIHRESTEGLFDTTLEKCLKQLRENDVEVVLIERQAPQELLDRLSEEGYHVACMDVLSSHSASEGAKGYLAALTENAEAAAAASSGQAGRGETAK